MGDDEGEEIQKFECKYCLYVTIRIKYLALHLQKKHEISIPMPRRPKYEIVGNKIVIVKQEIKEEVKTNENNNSDTNNKDHSEDNYNFEKVNDINKFQAQSVK